MRSLVLILVALDQVTKYLAETYLDKPLNIFNGLNFSLAHNYGAAFSFLSSQSGWQKYFFISIAVVLIAVMAFWIKKSENKLEQFSLYLILSGAIGNLIDRIINGFVIDFIDFYYQTWHFATFNLADVYISIGAFFLFLTILDFEFLKKYKKGL